MRALAAVPGACDGGLRLWQSFGCVYGSESPPDVFVWQLYTPDELTVLAEGLRLRLLVRCAGFAEQYPQVVTASRMQFVCEKV